jgi:uncharacterized membrane protein
VIIALVLCCASSDEDAFLDTQDDLCEVVHYNNFGEAFMVQNCLGCHHPESNNRQGAPQDVVLDNLDNIVQYNERIQIRIEEQTMPPQGGLSESNREMAILWLDCLGGL